MTQLADASWVPTNTLHSTTVTECTPAQRRRAQLAVAAGAVDAQDCALLLDALGLLGGGDASQAG